MTRLLIDIEPDAVLPGHGPVTELLAKVGTEGVTKLDLELQ